MKLASLLFGLSLCLSALGQDLSLTKKNLAGQKFLFEKGWYVITSPIEAWDYAVKNNETSREAFARAIDKIRLSKETTSERLDKAGITNKNIQQEADAIYEKIKSQGKVIQKKSFAASSKHFQSAWKSIVLGYIHYKEANQEDLDNLKRVNSEFFGKLKSDNKKTDEAVYEVIGFLLENGHVSWKKHFQEGKYSFRQSYEKSGTRGNSMAGLWDILIGYASWTYHSIITPSAKVAQKVPYYTLDVIAKTFIATSNVVYSIGSNFYYTTKLGYGVIAPSVESGLLASLAITEAIGGAVAGETLKTAGLINKVAIKSTGPVVGSGQFIIEESAARAKDSAIVLVRGAEAAGEVVVDKVDSGLVLGYSAISQIPAQLLLTSMNAAILLVYDGPKLILAKVSGETETQKAEDLPTGTVLNLNNLKNIGFKIEPLSDDPEIIKKVIENAQ